MADLPSAEFLRQIFSYDPLSGLLVWKVSKGTARSGNNVGATSREGYCEVRLNGRKLYAHRIIWCFVFGDWPSREIDHRNGDRSDNRLENLRLATSSQQKMNARIRSDNTTGVKGAFFDRRDGRYSSEIRANGRRIYLGRFATADEAHRAHSAAAEKLHGEFARPE